MRESIPALREASRRAAATRDDPHRPDRLAPEPEKLEHFESIGVTECVFRLPSAPRDDVLPVLDDYAEFVPRG